MHDELLFTVVGFNLLLGIFVVSIALLAWKPGLWGVSFALFAGLLVGLLDARSDEVGFTAVMLLAFGFYAGFAEPSTPWLKGILIALFIPLTTIVRWKIGLSHPDLFPGVLGTVVAFIPALAGAYGGSFSRQVKERLREPLTSEQNPPSEG